MILQGNIALAIVGKSQKYLMSTSSGQHMSAPSESPSQPNPPTNDATAVGSVGFFRSVVWRICRPIPIAVLIAILAAEVALEISVYEVTHRRAIDNALQQIEQVRIIRNYYTRAVVADVLQSSTMHASHEHANDPTAIPIPATFLLDISDLLAKSGTSFRLYSDLPFPSRASRQLDDFQKQAIDAVRSNPDQPFIARVPSPEGTILRVATADRLLANCVTCHNTHPQSPRKDWKEGDVRGILEGRIDVSHVEATATRLRQAALLGAVLLIVSLVVVVGWPAYGVRRRLQALVGATDALAKGRHENAPPIPTNGGDEVALLGNALSVFRGNAEKLAHAELQGQRLLNRLIDVAERVSQSTEYIKFSSQEIAQGGRDLASRTDKQASALRATVDSVSAIAASAAKNAENSEQALNLSSAALTRAENGDAAVGKMIGAMGGIENAATRIVHITNVMEEISFQTKLLALNAAVEAARAGEAGRGFAVVAQEVRTLADRSRQSSQQIRDLIAATAQEVDQGVKLASAAGKALSEIIEVIRRIAEIIPEIAAGSREQTRDISEIDRTLHDLDKVTEGNASLVEQSAASAAALAGQVEALAALVAEFEVASTKRD